MSTPASAGTGERSSHVARTVGEELAELAIDGAGPAGERIREIAGPREESLVEMAELLVEQRGDPERVEETREADQPIRAVYEGGGLLPGPDAKLAGPTFELWLAAAS